MKNPLSGVLRVGWIAWCVLRRFALVLWETPVVLYLMRTMPGGLLTEEHPWVTGQMPYGESTIWRHNLIYRSPGQSAASLDEDVQIIERVGRFLAGMVRKSVPVPEIPQGPKRRMPHAVNYLHGAVHYNGAWMLFDDIPDLIAHLSDRRFRRDLLRFGRRTRREVTFVLRSRRLTPVEFAWCVGCVRSFLPWFSNGNLPSKKPVLWGNQAPQPAIGLINGAWMADTRALKNGETVAIVRPPVSAGPHFATLYAGTRTWFTWFDRMLAWVMFNDVRVRGFKGQLFFTDRRLIEPNRLAEYREEGGFWRWIGCHAVPHPFQSTERAVAQIEEDHHAR